MEPGWDGGAAWCQASALHWLLARPCRPLIQCEHYHSAKTSSGLTKVLYTKVTFFTKQNFDQLILSSLLRPYLYLKVEWRVAYTHSGKDLAQFVGPQVQKFRQDLVNFVLTTASESATIGHWDSNYWPFRNNIREQNYIRLSYSLNSSPFIFVLKFPERNIEFGTS